MKKSLYFYIEPYVYIRGCESGIILINLLDDKAFTFKDIQSIKIGLSLLSSPKRTVKIAEEDLQTPIIIVTNKNFMGDIVSASSQPLQFYSEINEVSGIEAYRKSVIYSKYNIGRFISNCTIFVDMANQDCRDYIKCITGVESIPDNSICRVLSKMDKNDIDLYINKLVDINPNMTLNICGINCHLLDYISEKYPAVTINPILSLRTLKSSPELCDFIRQNKTKYTLLLDLPCDKSDIFIKDMIHSIYVKITNEEDIYDANNLSEIGCQIKSCPVLTSDNIDFIKSLLSISNDDLLNIDNKYRTIKINNLINSNFWGKIYVFPKGKVCYSLASDYIIELNQLYDTYKGDFLNGTFDWTITRNFSNCRFCMFQYLCPSPNHIETYLRMKGLIKMLDD